MKPLFNTIAFILSLAATDEAFAKLSKGTIESLLKPENKSKLIEILIKHVVVGRH